MRPEYNINMRVGETLEQYYKRIAKVADQRLVRLEQLAESPAYAGASKWAYNRAMQDIRKWSGGNAKRFNTKAPENKGQLKAKINDIQAFLGSITSTKGGINEVYKKRAETFNKKYNMDMKWQDLAKFLDKYAAEGYNRFDSEAFNRAISVVRSIKKSDPNMNAKKFRAMVEQSKNGEYNFKYVKKDGTDGYFDIGVQEVIQDLFSGKPSQVEAMYRLMVGR